MTLRKILCPIDFSPGSDHALRVAARLAKRDGAELVVAHVWYAGESAFGTNQFPSDALEQILDEEERGLGIAVRDAKRAGAERVSSLLLLGYPWQEIVDTLRQEPAFDMVVIGTRGRTGLSRVLLGSVAEKVVRNAPCPVLVAHEGIEVAPFRNVLCPIDFSESSRHALQLATELVEPDGTLTLLHVLAPPLTFRGEPSMPRLLVDLDARAQQLLEKWAADLRSNPAVRIATRLRTGSPGAETLAMLDEQPPFDLVVTGSRGRTGIRRALLGSVAEKILRHARCAVLVARSGEPD